MSRRTWSAWGTMAMVVLALTGCAQKSDTQTQSSTPNPVGSTLTKEADGISYVDAGKLMVLRGGQVEQVTTPGMVQAVGIGIGVDAGGLVVREAPAAKSARLSWYSSVTDKLNELPASGAIGSLGSVRYLSNLDSIWFSVYGDPDTLLKSATPPDAEAMTRALDSRFNGEFDVDSRGETIAYVGTSQNPSTLMLRDGEGESAVPTKLALIFSPEFSVDDTLLCFVGGQSGEDLSIWVFDRGQGELRELSKTRGLKPTAPVFSAEGEKVAFRSAEDGSLWIVDVASGKPQKLPVVADEGPIGW